MYVASVRYERGVLGLSNSIKYFFGELKEKKLTSEEAFFFVERLSNVTSTVNWDRIRHLKSRTNCSIDIQELERIYEKQIRLKRLKE
jgi:penicillin-binding protein 1A